MKLRFDKMHGLGNDFVIVDARSEPVSITSSLARAICNRHTGVGCDQMILLEPSGTADLRMRIWNSDGGEVQSCGNASRCVVHLTGARTVETAAGLLEGKDVEGEVEVSLGEPRFDWDQIPLAYPMDTTALPMGWGQLERPFAVNVGNPHLVFFVPDVAQISLQQVGPTIENDPVFPERINVNIAMPRNGGLQLRTFERGAGETLACGTGACATAVAAIATNRTTSPVRVDMPGGTLTISWAPGTAIRMRGPATHVFSGELDLEVVQ